MQTPHYANGFPVSLIFLRLLVGIASGFTGTVVLAIILLSTWSIVGDTITGANIETNVLGFQIGKEETHPLFLSIVIAGIFLGTLASSMTFAFLATATEERYDHRATILTQTFFGNLILLTFVLILYILGNEYFASKGVAAAGLIHCLLSSVFGVFILEIINRSRYLIVSTYGVIVGLILFTILLTIIALQNFTVGIFLCLPILLGCLHMGNALSEGIYSWFYRTYGADILGDETVFGSDYGHK